MGVEVATRSKQLHIHALPIMGLVLALTIVSAGCLIYYRQAGSDNGLSLSRALVTQVVHVRPGANGLAHVSIDNSASDQTAGDVLSPIATAGQAAEFTFSLQTKQ